VIVAVVVMEDDFVIVRSNQRQAAKDYNEARCEVGGDSRSCRQGRAKV
jgi:hypothetical protein